MASVIAKELYTGQVSSTGGRAGRAVSNEGILDLSLSRPGTGRGANPELLLAAGWSACFQGALAHVGRGRDIDTSASVVTARITLGNEADGSFALKAELDVSIPGLELPDIQSMADEAHCVCPYSKATRGNIEVQVRAVPAAA